MITENIDRHSIGGFPYSPAANSGMLFSFAEVKASKQEREREGGGGRGGRGGGGVGGQLKQTEKERQTDR